MLGILTADLQEHLQRSTFAEVNARDANGRTPLLWAAWLGYRKEVQLLIQHGAQLDSVDLQGSTALAKAVGSGHLECVRYLLKAGASMEIANRHGTLPIHLTAACQRYGVQLMESLFNRGADVNARSTYGVTPLYHAAFRGGLTNVKYLLSRGADIDATNAIGQTPTGKALSCQQYDVFCYLVREGARLDVEATNGHHILHIVASSGSKECLDVLDEAAREARLKNVSLVAGHDGHDLWHCFRTCRHERLGADREDVHHAFATLLDTVRASQS